MKKIIFKIGLNIVIICFVSVSFYCSSGSTAENDEGDTLLDVFWNRNLDNPIIEGGNNITDICDPTVIYDNGVWRLWASASIGDGKAYVCYSESRDGTNWDAPYIQFSPADTGWDNQKVEIPTVLKDETETDTLKRYKMWYGGANSADPDLTKIGYAYSADGNTWTRSTNNNGLVISLSNVNVYSDPTVVKINNTFHIWYNSFSETKANTLQINHATSIDGVNWNNYNDALLPSQAWENGSHIPSNVDDVVHPGVLWNSDQNIFMMYYGSFDASGLETYSGIGYAESPDGVNWIKSINNPVFISSSSSSGEKYGISTGPSIVYVNGKYHLFYSSVNSNYSRVICHAFSK